MTHDDKTGTERARRAPQDDLVGVAALGPLLQGLQQVGIDVPKFCRARGIDPALLEQGDAQLPAAALRGAWEEAARLAGDPAFALTCASRVEKHSFGLFSYVAATSDSWGTALRRIQDYFRLLGDIGRYDCTTAGKRVTLTFVPSAHWPSVGQQMADFALAVPQVYARRYVPGFQLCEVLFPYDRPADVNAHERLFAAPLRFGASELSLVFPAEFLGAPLLSADARLDVLLDGFAREKLATLPDTRDPLTVLRKAVREALQAGDATLAGTALRLGLAPRTLQRRLANAGTKFATEVDDARRVLALKLVAQPQFSLFEIAFLLGFSDLAPFHRAFRRWTGSTPGRFRASGTRPVRSEGDRARGTSEPEASETLNE